MEHSSTLLFTLSCWNEDTNYTRKHSRGTCVCVFLLLLLLFYFSTCHRLTVKSWQGKKWHWQSSNSEFEICWMCMGRLINSNYRFSSELNVCATSQSNDTILCLYFNRLFVCSYVSFIHSFYSRFHCHTVCCRLFWWIFVVCVWGNFTCVK